jgi:hypothetical protein
MKTYKLTKDYIYEHQVQCIMPPCNPIKHEFKKDEIIKGEAVANNIVFTKNFVDIKIPLSLLVEVNSQSSEESSSTASSLINPMSKTPLSLKIVGVALLLGAGYMLWKNKVVKFR